MRRHAPRAYGREVRTTAVAARVPPWAIDAVVGVVLMAVGLLSTATADPGNRERDGLAVALVLAATLPYVVRRRAPLPVFVVTALAVAALMLRQYEEGALPLILLLGAYTVGSECPAREVVTGAVLVESILVVLLVADVPGYGLGEALGSAAAFGAALAIGWTMQARRVRIEGFEEEQAEAARQAAASERLRIAQELHDVVAHSLGVIAVQAGAGMHVIDRDPAEARRALENISRMSRSSLTEIRWLLGRVRDADDRAAYAPAPGLGDLGRLADEVGGAGLAVDVTTDGDLDVVPPGVGLAAYRIVQEALTNALRHGHACSAEVRLDGAPGVLEVVVTDDGRGPATSGQGGHGLVGMRERAAVYGGSVDAGAGPDGGFRVAARLPFGQESS
jgi:signal transduction histidine kinase